MGTANWMTGVGARWLIVLAVSLSLAALTSCKKSPTGPSQVVGLRIFGVSTTPPGSTVQLTAFASYVDGSKTDVTATVLWHSSDTSVLTISATGLVTALQSGDVVVTASYNSLQASNIQGLFPIEVVPAGTYRLSGTVDGFGDSLDGALVQVTTGTGAGLSVLTQRGAYRLYGVAGPIQVSASSNLFATAVKTVTVTGNTDGFNFDLAPANPAPNLAGTYALRITADRTCATDGPGALPSAGRDRNYVATVTQMEGRLHTVLAGANFLPNSNSFYGLLALSTGTAMFFLDSYFYYKTFDVAEVLPDNAGIYALDGLISVAPSGADLVGMLDGTIRIKITASGTVVGQCTSAHHAVTLLNQNGNSSRMRNR